MRIFIVVKFFFVFFVDCLLGTYEQVGELFIIPICPTHGPQHIQQVINLFKQRRIGGVIFMEGKVETQQEILQLLKNQTDQSFFVFQDGEWGLGMRLYDLPNLPRNMTLGAIADLELLKEYGREVARQCHKLGVDSPLGPCVDINSNPLNPVIGSRSFGDDPSRVTQLALAVLEGMKEGGILGCAKHFPGHGDTAVDSHYALPVLEKPLSALRIGELLPFQGLIDNGVELVMVGHLALPALSPLPSSLSLEIITGLLRNEMGFKKMVVTDALNMHALTQDLPLKEIVEKSFLAGANLLLTATSDPDEGRYLMETGIPEAIDHLLEIFPEDLLAQRVESIRAFRNAQKHPLPPAPLDLCRQLYRNALTSLGQTKLLGASHLTLVQHGSDPDLEKFLSCYTTVKIVGFENFSSVPGPYLFNLKKGEVIETIPSEAVVAFFDIPYAIPDHPNVLVAYEDVPEMKEAVADALFTSFSPSGKLPVQVFGRNEW